MGKAETARQLVPYVPVERAVEGPVPDDIRQAYDRAMAVFKSLNELEEGAQVAATRLKTAVERLEALLAVDPDQPAPRDEAR